MPRPLQKHQARRHMIILGIDPGVATVGFGVIRAEGSSQTMIRCGVISTPANMRLAARLSQIYSDLLQLIDMFKPDVIAIEAAKGEVAQTYANIIAVRAGDENSDKTQALVNALQTEAVKSFIAEKYQGQVVAIF